MSGSQAEQRPREDLLVERPLPNVARTLPQRARWLRQPAGRFLLVGDIVAVLAIWAVVGPPAATVLAALVVLVATFSGAGLYRSRLTLSVLDDLPYITACVAACVLSAVTVDSWTSGSTASVHSQVRQLALLLPVLLLMRSLAYLGIRFGRRNGWVHHPVLVLGAGHIGIQLVRTMREHRDYGLDPVGFVDENPRILHHSDLPAPLLGSCLQLPAILDAYRVRAVIIAFGAMRESQLIDVLRECDRRECEIMFVPRLFEMHSVMRAMDDIRGIPLVRVRRAAFRTLGWRVKRLLDVLLAAPALILGSPIMLACAVAVRWAVGPGVLFRQERVGLDGRSFVVLKFRTLKATGAVQPTTTWTVSKDQEISRVGHFLRKTSLDELPQLWNVLIGDMSLVGPRPERPHFASKFRNHIPRYAARHRVPTGMTGWAQVNGLRGDTSIEDRAAFDNFYIENWSLWGDLKIILRTVGQVIRRGGS